MEGPEGRVDRVEFCISAKRYIKTLTKKWNLRTIWVTHGVGTPRAGLHPESPHPSCDRAGGPQGSVWTAVAPAYRWACIFFQFFPCDPQVLKAAPASICPLGAEQCHIVTLTIIQADTTMPEHLS